MKIEQVRIQNFHCIEDATVRFPTYFSAISGKNNAGKSTVLRAIRPFFFDTESLPWDEENITASDYPLWRASDENKVVTLSLDLTVYRSEDAGLFRFIQTFLTTPDHTPSLTLTLVRSYDIKKSSEKMGIIFNNVEEADYFRVQEIHKKLRASMAFISHNSTQREHPYLYRRNYAGVFTHQLDDTDKSKLGAAKARLMTAYKGLANRYKKELEDTLGRLEEKYSVGVTVPNLDMDSFPIGLTLADKKVELPLSDWGSGTQNRTTILLQLLRARQITQKASESDKITPIMVVEEPECFLHPSAQADFGRVLRDLSEEFGVQVICTTHSPYMLSLENPESNVLLERKVSRGQPLGAEVADVSGDNWMEPFATSLGLDNSAFSNWKDILFAKADCILLVEGETDVEYIKMLQRIEHGEDRLDFEGEIFAYGGSGFFSNTTLLKFFLSHFRQTLITYDLDVDGQVSKVLENLGLKRHQDFVPIGKDEDGKRDIEGLLPKSVDAAVFSADPDLVNVAISASKDNKSAKGKLKTAKLAEFKKQAKPGSEYFKDFYALVKILNRALKRQANN
jgi:putative ATP-dependent endonuclease of OLD family